MFGLCLSTISNDYISYEKCIFLEFAIKAVYVVLNCVNTDVAPDVYTLYVLTLMQAALARLWSRDVAMMLFCFRHMVLLMHNEEVI